MTICQNFHIITKCLAEKASETVKNHADCFFVRVCQHTRARVTSVNRFRIQF